MIAKFVDWLTYDVVGLLPESTFGQAINFFIYDVIKILLLLFVLIFIIGILRTFLPEHQLKKWVSKKSMAGHFYAALFGAVTPFCSCSSIPIFLSFLKAGIPLGVALSFLITSPLINEYLVVLMLGFFGWKITVVYVLGGLFIGIVSGMVIGRMNMERFLVADLMGNGNADSLSVQTYPTFKSRVQFGWREAVSIIDKVWVWVVIGVGVGALLHNYVPQELIEKIISKAGVFSVPLATILGVPMYGSCAAIVPIALVLFQKGIPLGTALAFMMAIAALSLPEAIMLRRAMKLPLIALFFAITTVTIIIIGYVFNFLQEVLI